MYLSEGPSDFRSNASEALPVGTTFRYVEMPGNPFLKYPVGGPPLGRGAPNAAWQRPQGELYRQMFGGPTLVRMYSQPTISQFPASASHAVPPSPMGPTISRFGTNVRSYASMKAAARTAPK